MALDVLFCKELMVNVGTFTLFPKHVTFTPRNGSKGCRAVLVLGFVTTLFGIFLQSDHHDCGIHYFPFK